MKPDSGLLRDTSKDNWAVRLHDLQMLIDNIQKDNRSDSLTNKEKLFLKVIYERMKLGNPCLVYCDYNEVINRLESIINRYKDDLGVKKIFKVTGEVETAKRERVEDLICVGSVTLITSAGTESINLQKADTLIFYDVPFSIVTFIQGIGRITRIDSKFSIQNIHIIESFGTIDTYKRILIQINGNMIKSLFGDIKTLPLQLTLLDKNLIHDLKRVLLWAFKKKELITEDSLKRLMGGK